MMNLTRSFLTDNYGKIFFLLRIPFTRLNIVLLWSGKPLEHKPVDTPLERQKKHFDNADPLLAGQAHDEAATMLGVDQRLVKAGKAKKNCWINWAGITWNDKTWLLVLRHIARYCIGKELGYVPPILMPHPTTEARLKQRGKKPGEQN